MKAERIAFKRGVNANELELTPSNFIVIYFLNGHLV
jgi:hypothetical protein